ncbi:30S ribosomal protein S15 [Candidatus Vidania fulgoroideorum]
MKESNTYISKLDTRIRCIQAHIKLHKKDFNSLRCVRRLFVKRKKYYIYIRRKSNVVKW